MTVEEYLRTLGGIHPTQREANTGNVAFVQFLDRLHEDSWNTDVENSSENSCAKRVCVLDIGGAE